MIVLATTAEIFIAQFAMKLFQIPEATEKIKSAKGENAIDALRNGVQTVFLSMFFFATSGTLMTIYLILVTVPEEVSFFMRFFESHILLFGGLTGLFLLVSALAVGGDSEKPNKGIAGVAIGSFLTAAFSFIVIMVYADPWAATRSSEWVFFLNKVCVAFAMGFFLFGSLVLARNLLDVLDETIQG